MTGRYSARSATITSRCQKAYLHAPLVSIVCSIAEALEHRVACSTAGGSCCKGSNGYSVALRVTSGRNSFAPPARCVAASDAAWSVPLEQAVLRGTGLGQGSVGLSEGTLLVSRPPGVMSVVCSVSPRSMHTCCTLLIIYVGVVPLDEVGGGVSNDN